MCPDHGHRHLADLGLDCSAFRPWRAEDGRWSPVNGRVASSGAYDLWKIWRS